MRRILITKEVVELAKDYADNLFKDRRSDFVMPLEKLNALSTELRNYNFDFFAYYVDNIIEFYPTILILTPAEFDDYYNDLFVLVPDDEETNAALFSMIIRTSSHPRGIKFYEAVVEAMRYNDVQSTEIRPYLKKLGIKACVYCNAAYAIATNDNKATFQVDHYYPKSKYPFLCTSFFNLFPSCMHCNQIKSKNTGYDYCLYTDDPAKVNPFYFTIDDKSIVKYMLTHNSEVLKFKLNSNPEEDADSHSSFFRLTGLYPHFSDAAEEVIWKAKIYDKTYQAQLMKAYKRKFPYNMDDFKRFYLGFYPDEKDVNMRPLTLLMQGIAKDMNLE